MHRSIIYSIFVLALTMSRVLPADEPRSSCQTCHENRSRMTELGFPHFTVTQAEVQAQSGMPATCSACHLGDPTEPDKEKAHRGVGRLLLVRKQGLRAEPAERRLPLDITGKGDPPLLTITFSDAKDGRKVVEPSVKQLVYQDKNPTTLSQDFALLAKTCGSCHPRQFKEFRTSAMGSNAKQSQYQSWSDPARGPHNCGVWFGDNYAKIAATTTVPFSKETSLLNQRSCNTCHVGCLDCHYTPMPHDPANPASGMHTFVKSPPPQSCYGGGRGTICHAGPEERRRGAGYFGGSYAFPEGAAADLHAVNKVGCLDCHNTAATDPRLGHGMVKRQTNCVKCHATAVQSLSKSVHQLLTCAACHVQDVGGYQGTFWGPGKLAGSQTPFAKFNDYYGIMHEPILLRDQNGRWIPVKPYPMAVMNQKSAELKPGLHWRWPKTLPDLQRTDDAYGYVGLVDGLPENNRALLWIQLDRISHKYGRSRGCDSCHGRADGEQRQEVSWEYGGDGAFPFKGKQSVVASRQGLFIRGMQAMEPIDTISGFTISSFAPWVYLQDKWGISGDFALPVINDRTAYQRLRDDPAAARQAGLIHR